MPSRRNHPTTNANVRVVLLRVCEKDEQMREEGINLQLYVGQRGAFFGFGQTTAKLKTGRSA